MLTKNLINRLEKAKSHDLKRYRKIISYNLNNEIIIDGKRCIDFSNNDYLGLKNHPKLHEALIHGAKQYGIGSGSSPLISGYSSAHHAIEEEFATWLNTDKAMLFSSGYAANISIMRALCQRSDSILSDKLCHASLLDGIILSRAKHYRYQHNDLQHLNQLANQIKPHLIVTESLFSMEGDISPIDNIVKSAKKHRAGLVIDDAHGIGILGNCGKGIMEHSALTQDDFTCLVTPLGKAFNLMGAIVAAKSEIIDGLIQFAKGYTYSTALSPAICVALHAALKLIKDESWRRQKLKSNINFFIAQASQCHLPLINKDLTPIKPIIVGCAKKTLILQGHLLTKGFYVSAIRPPTVPLNKARLKISLNAMHNHEQIAKLITALQQALVK